MIRINQCWFIYYFVFTVDQLLKLQPNKKLYFKSSRIYGTTKLANILFCKELSRRLQAKGYHVSLWVITLTKGYILTTFL